MTRKDYEAIARSVKNTMEVTKKSLPAHAAVYSVVQNLCEVFEQDNPRFNAERFIAACGFDN